MQLDVSEILSILKHRYPLVLIDGVLNLVPQESCEAFKNISYNEWFFPAHFVGSPIMPGSLQVEMYTQAVAITLLVRSEGDIEDAGMPILFSVDRVRFYKAVSPGDRINIEVMVDKRATGIVMSTARGFVGRFLVSECKIGYRI
ncbi:MAG: hypothetical protein CBB97_24230 [Candidatus Endolissoclinum sp. TMED37]|nr:MAG: hypothetical protein CBB97_24230 [Candidatus Endolissoclinum sp. TMED37]